MLLHDKDCMTKATKSRAPSENSENASWPRGYNYFHAQLNMKLIMLINIKMPTTEYMQSSLVAIAQLWLLVLSLIKPNQSNGEYTIQIFPDP